MTVFSTIWGIGWAQLGGSSWPGGHSCNYIQLGAYVALQDGVCLSSLPLKGGLSPSGSLAWAALRGKCAPREHRRKLPSLELTQRHFRCILLAKASEKEP